jgi:hypothetical protein
MLWQFYPNAKIHIKTHNRRFLYLETDIVALADPMYFFLSTFFGSSKFPDESRETTYISGNRVSLPLTLTTVQKLHSSAMLSPYCSTSLTRTFVAPATALGTHPVGV